MNDPVRFAENRRVAQPLREAADLLEAQQASPFRVSAYRRAADAVEHCPRALADILAEQGREGFEALPGVGPGIAAAIGQMLSSGRWPLLDRLRGDLDPTALFMTLPGVGPRTARRIHDVLGIDTLEALEIACHDGTLECMTGFGRRRTAALRAALGERLARMRPRLAPLDMAADEPSVDLMLDVDREYRERAAAGTLPRIAPRRFNPAAQAWLPVMHARRGDWHFTALFSNTARAHELGRTRDWVVLYFDGERHAERQRTVVTERVGPLAGRRVVRGRETECRSHYAAEATVVA